MERTSFKSKNIGKLDKKQAMIVERKDNEILVRFSAKTKASKIQTILDYLRYEEMTFTSVATKRNVEDLLQKAKKGRWEKIKKETGLDN